MSKFNHPLSFGKPFPLSSPLFHRGNIQLFLFLAALAFGFHSCQNDGNPTVSSHAVRKELTLTLVPGHWVYYSITDSCVVGQGLVANAEDDSLWYARTDWDIAFSEEGMRTNSSASGCGKGGLQSVTGFTFDELQTVPEEGYQTDKSEQSLHIPEKQVPQNP